MLNQEEKYNEIVRFGFDPGNQSFFDSIQSLEDKEQVVIDENSIKIDFQLEEKFEYDRSSINDIKNEDPEKLKRRLTGIGRVIYGCVVSSSLISRDADFNEIEIKPCNSYGSNSDSGFIPFDDFDNTINVLSNNNSFFIRVTGRTIMHIGLRDDSLKNDEMKRVFNSIARPFTKLNLKNLKYVEWALRFIMDNKLIYDNILNPKDDFISIYPPDMFNRFRPNLHGFMRSYDKGASKITNEGEFIELSREGNTLPIDKDFESFVMDIDRKVATVVAKPILFRLRDREMFLYNSLTNFHVGYKLDSPTWRQTGSVYREHAEEINRGLKVLKDRLYDFLAEHQDEIVYRSFLVRDDSYVMINAITNVHIEFGSFDFLYGMMLRLNLQNLTGNSKGITARQKKEVINNFVKMAALRTTDTATVEEITGQVLSK